VSAITDKPYFAAAQERQRVAPWGSAVATPTTVPEAHAAAVTGAADGGR
jgi:hypothetical protein